MQKMKKNYECNHVRGKGLPRTALWGCKPAILGKTQANDQQENPILSTPTGIPFGRSGYIHIACEELFKKKGIKVWITLLVSLQESPLNAITADKVKVLGVADLD